VWNGRAIPVSGDAVEVRTLLIAQGQWAMAAAQAAAAGS
jgi:hypothetical protein